MRPIGFCRLASPEVASPFQESRLLMPCVVLYHIPPSFYSQIARLTLCELGVSFDARLAVPGPPTFDTYQPWYLRMNSMGTVPTLVHGEKTVADSDAIMRYAAAHLSTIKLEPEQPERREIMETWIGAMRNISLRELSYGAEKTKRLGAKVNKLRIHVLARRKARYPELAPIYERKIEDISEFAARATDPDVAVAHRQQVEARLTDLNRLLDENRWITGDTYSLADAVWTVTVARLKMLGFSPLENRPALDRWYAEVKARPSFKEADIWESFKALPMVRTVGRRFRVPLLITAAGLAALLAWCSCPSG